MTEPLDILIFGAHPDDAEIGMGGTIVKHVKAGLSVGICELTYAELSSNGTVERRQAEASQASSALGITVRTNLGLPDRGLFICKEQIDAVAMEIRKHRPRLVFAPYWEDRHPDHIMCSKLVQEAVFTAKLRNYRPDIPPVTVEGCYFYFINDLYEADLMVDISGEQTDKMKALGCYRSQFEAAGTGEDRVATPLTQGYLERVVARDRLLGMKRQVDFAEGFISKLPYLVDLF